MSLEIHLFASILKNQRNSVFQRRSHVWNYLLREFKKRGTLNRPRLTALKRHCLLVTAIHHDSSIHVHSRRAWRLLATISPDQLRRPVGTTAPRRTTSGHRVANLRAPARRLLPLPDRPNATSSQHRLLHLEHGEASPRNFGSSSQAPPCWTAPLYGTVSPSPPACSFASRRLLVKHPF